MIDLHFVFQRAVHRGRSHAGIILLAERNDHECAVVFVTDVVDLKTSRLYREPYFFGIPRVDDGIGRNGGNVGIPYTDDFGHVGFVINILDTVVTLHIGTFVNLDFLFCIGDTVFLYVGAHYRREEIVAPRAFGFTVGALHEIPLDAGDAEIEPVGIFSVKQCVFLVLHHDGAIVGLTDLSSGEVHRERGCFLSGLEFDFRDREKPVLGAADFHRHGDRIVVVLAHGREGQGRRLRRIELLVAGIFLRGKINAVAVRVFAFAGSILNVVRATCEHECRCERVQYIFDCFHTIRSLVLKQILHIAVTYPSKVLSCPRGRGC